MRLAILRSQPRKQYLPPPLKQFEMHTCSEHTTALAVGTPITVDAESANTAMSMDRRSMESPPGEKAIERNQRLADLQEADEFDGSLGTPAAEHGTARLNF
jgi:hypothetical protein